MHFEAMVLGCSSYWDLASNLNYMRFGNRMACCGSFGIHPWHLHVPSLLGEWDTYPWDDPFLHKYHIPLLVELVPWLTFGQRMSTP